MLSSFTLYSLLLFFFILTGHGFLPLSDRRRPSQNMSSAGKNNENSEGTFLLSTTTSASSRVVNTLNPCVVLMQQLVQEHQLLWKEKGGIYSLAQGIVYWNPPESVNQALRDALQSEDQSLHLYGPDEGLPELRKLLQKKIQVENGLMSPQYQVMVTSGANQAYMNCVLTLLDPNDQAVVFAPYYFNHVMALQLSLSKNENILIGPTTDQGKPDIEWLRESFQSKPSVRMVTITNPNNPLGVFLTREDLQPIVDLCEEFNAFLILDCTYEYFVPDTLPCFNEAPHVLYIFSFSKSYALAGYRIGYVVLSSSHLYQQMMKVQDTIPICPSRISQVAAVGAMQAGKRWVLQQYDTLSPGRQAILQALQDCPRIIGGQGAMYIMAQLPTNEGNGDSRADDVGFARQLVRDSGVAVIPGSFCGAPGWIRVCYANLPPEKCQLAADRLKAGLASWILEIK
jgi:aspartate/methionine/tyrosine aminotransferase